jgi:hypothetical protein
MAPPLLTRKKLVLVKTESTELTDAVPTTVANALLAEEASITPTQAVIERPALKPYWSSLKSVAGGYYADWSLTFELKGGGADDADCAIPDWDPVFRACGMKRTREDATPLFYEYRPYTTGVDLSGDADAEAAMSMTMYLYEDGTIWKLAGCHGSLSITMTAGERAMVTAEGQGFCTSADSYTGFNGGLAAHADIAFPTSATFDSTVPPVALSIGWEMGGVANTVFKASTFTVDLGNEIGLRPNMNRTDGYQGCVITGRNVTGAIDPEMNMVGSAVDFYGLIKNQTDGAIACLLTEDASLGRRVAFEVPVAQVVSFAEGDRNGVITADLGLAFRESSGDDELVVKVY